MKKINNKGFTLVELLLVIAIIGILAAVLFVSLGSQRERARITAFKEQMRALVPAITTCIDSTGTLQNTAAGNICSTGATHGLFLTAAQMVDCDGAGPYALSNTLATGVTGDITGTCTRDGNDCVAVCTMQGCTFTDCD